MSLLNQQSDGLGIDQTGGALLPFWIAVMTAIILVGAALATATNVPALVAEGGAVETASAVLWVFSAATLIWFAPKAATGAGWHITALFLLLAAREWDMDKAYLSQGILKARLYTGDAPIAEKLIGLTVVAAILWIVIRLVRHNLGDWLRELRARAAWAWVCVGAMVLAVIAKSVDGVARKLEPFGIELSAGVIAAAEATEEAMELGLVLSVVLAICLWARTRASGA